MPGEESAFSSTCGHPKSGSLAPEASRLGMTKGDFFSTLLARGKFSESGLRAAGRLETGWKWLYAGTGFNR